MATATQQRRRPALYVLPGANPGLVIKGNVDINNRPSVANPRGGTSTVFSASSEVVIDGHRYEMLYPTVIPNGRGGYKIVSSRQAYFYALKSGKHLGIFDTPAHAESYAIRLHRQQARLIAK